MNRCVMDAFRQRYACVHTLRSRLSTLTRRPTGRRSCHRLFTPILPLPVSVKQGWDENEYVANARVADETVGLQHRKSQLVDRPLDTPTCACAFDRSIVADLAIGRRVNAVWSLHVTFGIAGK